MAAQDGTINKQVARLGCIAANMRFMSRLRSPPNAARARNWHLPYFHLEFRQMLFLRNLAVINAHLTDIKPEVKALQVQVARSAVILCPA